MKKNNRNFFLINAANLHSGGAIQVATSFINEVISIERDDFDVVVSSEIDKELRLIKAPIEKLHFYTVIDVHGLHALHNYEFTRLIFSYRTVFTIFGPLYVLKKPIISIVGFAQPWVIYPNNEIFMTYGFFKRIMIRFKFSLQKYFYFKSDKLIVELDHVKEGLQKLIQNTEIIVINNCISSVFFDRSKWLPVDYMREDDDIILLGIVSRDYSHKNLDILPDIAKVLKHLYKMKVKFLVTLTNEEWLNRKGEFHTYVDNVGPINTVQCPSFYNLLDGVIFPSLLECFSATPIEAMMMKKPVFASDRLFVRQACGNFVNYFNPTEPKSIAKMIYNYFVMREDDKFSFVEDAYKHALKYNNPSKRAMKYIQLV